jgi:hypothetical protein
VAHPAGGTGAAGRWDGQEHGRGGCRRRRHTVKPMSSKHDKNRKTKGKKVKQSNNPQIERSDRIRNDSSQYIITNLAGWSESINRFIL